MLREDDTYILNSQSPEHRHTTKLKICLFVGNRRFLVNNTDNISTIAQRDVTWFTNYA